MNNKEVLELFLQRVEELRGTRLVQEGYDSGFTMNWSQETGYSEFTFKQPDEELFRSMLLTLRHFLMKKEPTYIYKIYNICHCSLLNEKHKKYLSKSRKFLDGAMKSTGIGLQIDDQHFSPQHIWDIYINGIYFHNDTEKRKNISQLPDYQKNLIKNELYGFVNSCFRQIFYTGKIVDYSFRHKEFSF
jgi:hypothetical protein